MDLAETMRAIVGPTNVLLDADVRAPYEVDWTRRFSGSATLVVRPGSTGEVSGVVTACRTHSAAIVTQGGNTGLVGGGVPGPPTTAPTVVLSTVRLNRLEPVDTIAAQVTAGAGATLARLQEAAASKGFQFPVDLAARDTATVGGMVATNAGGLHVMRYGSMRAQVVGLEAVLADGRVISRLSGLIKDNTGYDLSQLMIGSEGTLGVITAVRVRLVASHPERVVALIGVSSTEEALATLTALRGRVESLQAAELFFDDGLDLVREHARLSNPLPKDWPVYLTLECAGVTDPSDEMFAALASLDLPDEATAVAADLAGCARLWEYRERHTEAISSIGIPHKLDVTLPQARLPEFERRVRDVTARAAPGSRLVLFGHVGDGNLHVNVVGPPADDEAVDDAVLELVASMDGSISAEHGVGRAKVRWLGLSRSEAELSTMRSVKDALDPEGIFNPGVLLPG